MKEKNKIQTLTSNVAITLIALIITIIVMLILVGVTVNIALNGGLFTNAEQAKISTQDEIDIETTLSEGKVQVDGKWYNSMDDYLDGKVFKETGGIEKATNISDYGKIVTNFKSKKDNTLIWRIFYEDSKNVYLISETENTDYPVKNLSFYQGSKGAYNKNKILEKYNSGADVSNQGQDLMPHAREKGLFNNTNIYENIIATAYLCDTSEDGPWDEYRDEAGKAVWAMGGPTIELFIASYNATQNKEVVTNADSIGYNAVGMGNRNELSVDMNNGIYRLKDSGYFWIASPYLTYDGVRGASGDDGCLNAQNITGSRSARPIVCIPKFNFKGFNLQ